MVHGDTVIYESLAIATYLDVHFGGPRLVPEDAEAVRTMQWVGVHNDSVQEALTVGIVLERVVKPMFGMETNEATIAENLPKVQHILPVLDAAVADSGHFGSAEPTLADWYFVPSIAYGLGCSDTADLIAAQPNLSTWFERMNARDAVAVTVPHVG
ncbi:MAG: glutathione S-transferase family protein [Rhodospirillales bacterium]|nr:glutathione S-transferase family protein [Rhodospirillales bacterium]